MSRIGRNVWGKAAVVAIGAVAVLAIGGFAAWRMMSRRLGEEAIQYIPSDASMVFSFDTAPSTPAQAALFKQIGDDLDKEGLLKKLDYVLGQLPENARIVKDLRPYCTKSTACALWITGARSAQTPPFVWLTALTDPNSVDGILAKYGSPAPDDGTKTYKLKSGDTYIAVVHGYLVLSNKAELIGRVEATAGGSGASIASLAEYKAARQSLPDDANFMFFMSPAGIKASEKIQGGTELYAGLQWAAYSVSIRDAGLSFDYQYPAEARAGSIFEPLAKVKPIDPIILKRLPAGAYGATVVAQPAVYWPFLVKSMQSQPMVKSAYDEGVKQFQQQTGLNVDRDVVPAFNGDAVLAVYPADGGKNVDIVVEATDANAADPAALAEKIRVLVEKKSGEKGGKLIRMVSSKDGDATVWTLDESSRAALMSSANGSPESPTPSFPSAATPPGQSGMPPSMQGPGFNPTPQPPAGNAVVEALKDKTVCYAIIGKTVILSSSKASLQSAMAAYRGQGKTLADDPAYATMQAKLTPQSQAFALIDIGKICDALRPTLEAGLKQSDIKANDILGIFGDGKMGIMSSGRYDGKLFKGSATLPLDYAKLIRLIGKVLDLAPSSPPGARGRM